jgi:hypothetical protein
MARPYEITISNGTGTATVENSTYSVTANVPGYDNTTISPTSVTVSQSTSSYNFTISATGTLTIHITEDGTASGTAVEGATLVRTDSSGTAYGTPITTDASGNAVFNNVPFGTSTPTIYYKQTATATDHSFDDTVQSITMTNSTQTVEIENPTTNPITVNLLDANYENLQVDSGTITLS